MITGLIALIGVAATIAVAAAVSFFWWLWWQLPRHQARRLDLADDKARADVEDNFRKTIGQALGGVAVLIGAGFAYLQFTQLQRGAHDLLISNQVAKGFELLGEKDLSQRLGGIYALEGVMNDSERYRKPVLEALCAFVRETQLHGADVAVFDVSVFDVRMFKAITQTLGAAPAQHQQGGDLSPLPADVQAALTVIGRREIVFESVCDLHGADIPKAEVSDDAPGLQRANLSGANLRGADLSGADLFDTNLSGANLSGAKVIRLFGANLRGANLSGANLSHADLISANLRGADMSGTDLRGADMSGTDLRGARGLDQAQLDAACGDKDAKVDPPLTIKPCKQQ